jgi:phage host-nuclease inhibitor protein Gam
MTETIQQLKEDIAILQEKLNKLEEAEKMMLMRQGKVDIVDYYTKTYYRIEYTDSFSGAYVWFVRRRGEDYIRQVRDVNVYGVLEDYYQKHVMKQIEEYPYKKYTPDDGCFDNY